MICKIVCKHCPAQAEVARLKSIAIGFAILAAANFVMLCAMGIGRVIGGMM